MAATTAQRRTLRHLEELTIARTAGTEVIISGPAVNDVLLDESERALFLTDLLRSYCQNRALGYVTYRLGTGAVSHPTLPEGGAVPITAGQPDEHPAQAAQAVPTIRRRRAGPRGDPDRHAEPH